MDKKVLKEFGLTDNEVEIFLILVKKGSLSATSIAKETGLNRPYVYYALERLLEKGYVSEVRDRGKKTFQTIGFERIIALEEQKVDLLKNLREDIHRMKEDSGGDVAVEVLKGKYAVRNVFRQVLSDIKPGKEILYLGIDEEKMETIEPIFLSRLLTYFRENKISEKVILKKGGKTLSYAKTTKYKFLDSVLIGNTARVVYQDVVIEIIYGDPVYAIVVKNLDVAKTAKKQFEVFWKLARN